MTAVRKLERAGAPAPIPRELDPEARVALNSLRTTALKCRSSAQLDLFRACRMLSADHREANEAVTEALIRTLGQSLGRKPRFYRPHSHALTFDEAWILSLLSAIRQGDEDSATFLLCSRVGREARRSVAFLATGLAAHLDTI